MQGVGQPLIHIIPPSLTSSYLIHFHNHYRIRPDHRSHVPHVAYHFYMALSAALAQPGKNNLAYLSSIRLYQLETTWCLVCVSFAPAPSFALATAASRSKTRSSPRQRAMPNMP